MSKAFVREDAEGVEPAADEPALPPGPRLITPEGYARLAAELAVLEAGAGDRAPGGASAALPRAGDRERRVHWLRRLLAKLSVVDAPPDDPERVFFGACVTVEDETGARTTYRLVGPDEVDAAAGWISVESPVARALLGRRAGDVGIVRRPRGDAELRITRVSYAADA
jgi:transcription elongation factor GreB